ncbi:hypothetical protein NCLIV_068500 [Neospora caninum Liverpool]|uniref:Exonuclease 1 n=1 Tax=Neospora caninum (strain Liverpool) TaxID=572307 RepID=F0VRS8_NEOCL|nr:hypothetical protein NCLIV_068500 [Neospora caninum Liverpool]CBZ56426.1 hypothetical protein NCLIV_068500 [Neospora caninum Liverpool]CEL71185.1 TPA: Exonuclease 1 [Neospora caninum Liverpool]|eukprot:XP_003886451.1 hypothetical protein NCLIV_068500 [Neospora caninum Liverpool]
MGVKGLWNWLGSNIKERTHLREFSGKTIAVDASSWLHKAACGCALALLLFEETRRLQSADGEPRGPRTGVDGERPREAAGGKAFQKENGDDEDIADECEAYHQILRFCLGKIRLLTSFGIRPFLVFEGGQLEAKAPANESRRLTRERHAVQAVAAHRAGDVGSARRHAVGAISVSLSLRNFVFRKLQSSPGVICIAAAYEADAQMARLAADGLVDAVLTEDGDLLAYQARKLICVLAGCDYAPNIPGVGVRTAARLVQKYGADVHAILQDLRASGKPIPNNYAHQIRVALLTYRHQTVFVISPTWEIRMAPLTDLPSASLSPDTLRCLGVVYDDDTARSLCLGFRHPTTLKMLHPRMQPRTPPPLYWLRCEEASAKTQQTTQLREAHELENENEHGLANATSTPSGADLKHIACSPDGKLSAGKLGLLRRRRSSAREAEDECSGDAKKAKKYRSEKLSESQRLLRSDACTTERETQLETEPPGRCSLETCKAPHVGVSVHRTADPRSLAAEANPVFCEEAADKEGNGERPGPSFAEAPGQLDEMEGPSGAERKPSLPAERAAVSSPVLKSERSSQKTTFCSSLRTPNASVALKRNPAFFGLLGVRRGLPGLQRKDSQSRD